MKFKLGDTVKVKDYKYCLKHLESFNENTMVYFCNHVGKIVNINNYDGHFQYFIDFGFKAPGDNWNSRDYFWTVDCLEKHIPKIMEIE